MRDELLNETLFFGLDHAREKVRFRVHDYNHQRPHSSLGYATPVDYAAALTATGDRLRNPDQLRRSAATTLSGIELMHMSRKGQLRTTGELRPAQQFYALAA